MFAGALELVKGNPKMCKLPSTMYDPTLPYVRLVRKDNNKAAEIIYFFKLEEHVADVAIGHPCPFFNHPNPNPP